MKYVYGEDNVKEGWVWFRHKLHREPRAGYLKMKRDGSAQVLVPMRRYLRGIVFRYRLQDLVLLEPLPEKTRFKLTLTGYIKDFTYENEDIKA